MLPQTEKWRMQTALAPSPASQWNPSTGCWSSLSFSSQASLCTPSYEQTASAGSSQDRSMSIKTEKTPSHRNITYLLMLQVIDGEKNNNLCDSFNKEYNGLYC